MREAMLRRLLRVGIVMAVTTIMLGVTTGLSAAAPGDHGRSGKNAASASDQAKDTGTRPGWGCGDRNHVHTGPPGLGAGAVSPCTKKSSEGSTQSSGAATHFSVSAPSSASAGSSFSFTVRALDQNNNTATSYGGTVHFTSSDTGATLPSNSTLSSGVATFSATLNTVGNQTITATDSANSSMAGTSGNIAVSASGAATHFAVSAPSSANAGSSFSFTVRALDQNNNTATSYGGTVHFTSSDAGAALPANSTLSNGVGTFSATLNTVAVQTISATDSANSAITGASGNIAVSASGAATHFAVSAPSSAITRTAFTFTVTALDQNNNTATSYGGTVHFTSTDALAMLPANSTLTSGVGTFTATLNTVAVQTISASDSATPSMAGTSGNTTVSASGAATHFTVSAPSSAIAGNSFSFTVTALDENNNTATSYGGTVHFTSTDTAAVLPIDAVLTNGVVTLPATLKSVGFQTIAATDTSSSSVTATSRGISVR